MTHPPMALRVQEATDEGLRAAARAVRSRVFVEEQGVAAALERDAHDASCPYVLALLDGEPVAAARHLGNWD